MTLGRQIGGRFVALALAVQAIAVLAMAVQAVAVQAVAAELVMVRQPGCEWCERWQAEIAPSYPNSAEGRFAPLRQVDLQALPDDLVLARRIAYTPTFLIVENGRELARLEGYPGADFFWPLLAELLTRHAGFDPARPAAADATRPLGDKAIKAGDAGKT